MLHFKFQRNKYGTYLPPCQPLGEDLGGFRDNFGI